MQHIPLNKFQFEKMPFQMKLTALSQSAQGPEGDTIKPLEKIEISEEILKMCLYGKIPTDRTSTNQLLRYIGKIYLFIKLLKFNDN